MIGILVALAFGPCDRVDVRIEDPSAADLLEPIGTAACQALRVLGALFEVPEPRVQLVVLADMDAWRQRVGRSYYIGAALVGEEIVLQPARSLRRLGALQEVIAHEVAHLFIRRVAGRACPRWLDEGLAQLLAGDGGPGKAPADPAALLALEKRLASRDALREARLADYASARAAALRLTAAQGQRAVLAALPAIAGSVDPLAVRIGERSIGALLFEPAQSAGATPGPGQVDPQPERGQ